MELVWIVAIFMMVIAFVGGGIWGIWTYIQYKYDVVIKVLTSDGSKKFVIKRKARVVKDKKNKKIRYFKIFRFKHLYPLPPSTAVEMTHSGRFFVQCYMNELEEISYCKDVGSPHFFQSMNTNQRMILMDEIEKAAARKPTDWMQYLMPIAGGFMLLIFMIVMFSYWEDIHKPSVQVVQAAGAITHDNLETAKIMQDILKDKQTFMDFYYGNWSSTGGLQPPN